MRVKTKRVIRKRDVLSAVRKKFCRLCVDKVKSIDYKDARRLEGKNCFQAHLGQLRQAPEDGRGDNQESKVYLAIALHADISEATT
jgi:ribosomal protein L32E